MTATGRLPSPICQAAAENGGRLSGYFLVSTVPMAKPMEPPSAISMPGSFSTLAAKPLPPMMAARPANAITSEITRNRFGRSPSTGQARIEAQIGSV
jgi:hypothetical protein